jgi:hypothetical protein
MTGAHEPRPSLVEKLENASGFSTTPQADRYLIGIPKYGTAQPTIFWNAGAATAPP